MKWYNQICMVVDFFFFRRSLGIPKMTQKMIQLYKRDLVTIKMKVVSFEHSFKIPHIMYSNMPMHLLMIHKHFSLNWNLFIGFVHNFCIWLTLLCQRIDISYIFTIGPKKNLIFQILPTFKLVSIINTSQCCILWVENIDVCQPKINSIQK